MVRKGVRGKPKKGVLKTCSAGRKDFFDTLKRRAKYAAFFAMDILR